MRKFIALSILLSIIVFSVGCTAGITAQDSKTKSNNLETDLQQIPELQTLVSIKNTLHTFSEISESTVTLVNGFSAKETSKDDFCTQVKQKEDSIININKALKNKTITGERIDDDVILRKKIQEFESSAKGIGNLVAENLKKVSNFCQGGSITELTGVTKVLEGVAIDYRVHFENRARSAPGYSGSYERTGGYEHIAVLFDELKETLSTKPAPPEKNIYGVGDTIEKKGIKVTLKSVKKNYIHPEWSYVKNDREWTDNEWNNDIIKYQFAWNSERDPNLKQQIAAELNQKYGSRVKENLIYQYFDYSFQNLPNDLSNRFNDKSTSAIVNLYILGTEESQTEKFSLNYGYIRGLFNIPQKYTDNKVKLVIGFDNCAFTMEEIESVEKNQNSCPQTFIFTVDMSKISNWENY